MLLKSLRVQYFLLRWINKECRVVSANSTGDVMSAQRWLERDSWEKNAQQMQSHAVKCSSVGQIVWPANVSALTGVCPLAPQSTLTRATALSHQGALGQSKCQPCAVKPVSQCWRRTQGRGARPTQTTSPSRMTSSDRFQHFSKFCQSSGFISRRLSLENLKDFPSFTQRSGSFVSELWAAEVLLLSWPTISQQIVEEPANWGSSGPGFYVFNAPLAN